MEFISESPYTATLLGGMALVALGGASLIAYRLGLFKGLVIKDNVLLGPYLVIYREVKGPYSRLGPEFAALAKQMVDTGLVHVSEQNTHPTLGVYLTNPRTTPPNECRALVGSVYKAGPEVATRADVDRMCGLLSKLSVVRTGEVKVGHIPASLCIATKTPLPGELPAGLSVAAGALRAYPALTRAVAGKEGIDSMVKGSIEYYNWQAGQMVVAMPVIKRDSILVPLDLATPLTMASLAGGSKASKA